MSAKKIEHEAIIKRWIVAMNTLDKEKYLAFFTDDAVLDDPSVGRKFKGKEGIGKYFEAYFIGYNTRTRLVSVVPEDGHFHVDVHFTGDFPGGKTEASSTSPSEGTRSRSCGPTSLTL